MKAVSPFLSLALALLALATAPHAVGASLKLVGETDSYLFAGRPGKVQVTLENNTSERLKQSLNYRVFQASSATLAPLRERESLGEMEFPPGQRTTISIPFVPPEVRAISLFVMKVYVDEQEIGSISITASPPKIFSPLIESGVNEIQLHEPDNLLRPILEISGLKVTDPAAGSEAKLLIVRLPSAAAETEWRDRREAATLPTLFIVGRGATGFEKVLPAKFLHTDQARRAAIVQDWFVPDLKEKVLSQLRLLRAIQLLLNPDKEPDPSGKKKDN